MQKNSNDSNFWSLVARILAGHASQEETVGFHRMLLQDKNLMELFLRAQDYWSKTGNLSAFDSIDVEKDWQLLMKKISEREKAGVKSSVRSAPLSNNIRRALPYAAAVLALVAVIATLFLWQSGPAAEQPVMYTTIEAPIGSRSRVELPDGSSVMLNAGSSITYSSDFNVRSRDIQLEGEAFFDVVKQDCPFMVNVMDVNLRVIGTSFNVKAYEDDEVIETTLVSGSLVIEDAPGYEGRLGEIALEPNQKATFFRESGELALAEDDTAKEKAEDIAPAELPRPARTISRVEVLRKSDITPEIGWKDGVIVVESEPLNLLARRLERRYDVRFEFADESLKAYRYTGQLRELTLEQVLHALKLTSPIDYTIDDKTVTIRENPLTRGRYNQYLN